MNERLRALQARAEAARRAYEQGRDRLYTNGRQTFSDELHREEMGKLTAARNRELAEVEEGLLAAFEEANAQIQNLEHRDPTELLDQDALASANARRPFALDQAESLPVEALAGRLESVLAGGGASAIFAWWLAAGHRRERILERRREAARRGSDNPAAASQISTVTELDDVLGRMHEALDGGRTAAAVEEARGRLVQIFEIQQTAHFIRHETTSVYSPNLAINGR